MDFCWQQMRDQHFSRLSSVLPRASSQTTASTKKVEFFCANTQYYCEMNPLYFYFLSLSRFFSPLEGCAVPFHEMRLAQNRVSSYVFLEVTASRRAAVVTGELH